jgi:hypothetical protein
LKIFTKTNSGSASVATIASRAPRAAPKRWAERNTPSGGVAPRPLHRRNGILQHSLAKITGQSDELASSVVRGQTIALGEPYDLIEGGKEWSHDDFALEVQRAHRIGLKKLSSDQLLGFCRNAHGYIQKRSWVNSRPFFVELFRRIKKHQVPGVRTKTEACRIIGCTLRWAEAIIAGTARGSNKPRPIPRNSEQCLGDHRPQTVEDVSNDISRYAFRMLDALRRRDGPRYQTVCKMLAEHFRKEAQIEQAAE